MIKNYQLSGFSFQQVNAGTSGSKMVAKKVLAVLFLFLITSTTLLAQTPSFDQLKERFDSGEIFAADFDHTYTDSYTEEIVRSSGNIWIDKVRYKLESDGQTVVVNGENSQVYDPQRNRVIIDTYYPEDDDFAPSRMLSGIDSTYTVSEERSGNQTMITLTTNDDFAVFVEVRIMLDAQLHPLEIKAWDISDNEIVTTFTNGRFHEPEDGLFELDYPDDAEIVDMRY
jgi:outer membrane lipoprotein-sorting protein